MAVLLCVSASPVRAADDGHSIKIIHEDGRVDVIDLRQIPQPAPEVPREIVPEKVPAAAPVEVPQAPQAPTGQTVAAPAPAPAVKAVEKAAPKKPAAKKSAVKAKAAPPPKPAVVTPPRLPVQREIENGQAPVITRGKAISIALGYAPPSTDVEVYRASFQGRNVYAVEFKTEAGFHEVLIDDQTGKVLESRESEAFRENPVRPGHLPADLR